MTRRGCLVVVLALACSLPAGARAGEDEVARAAAELERARAAAGEAGAAWEAARDQERAERALLEQMVGEVAAGQLALKEARTQARERARLLYITAGTGAASDEEGLRRAYAAAVGRTDREALNLLRAAVADLERRRAQVRERVAAYRLVTARLAGLAAEAGPVLAAAEAEYHRLRTAWEVQEAERLRREQQTATTSPSTPVSGEPTSGEATTTSTTPGTTTATPPGAPGTAFAPAVERWRELVARFFPAELVDQALAVIACESLGDPAVVNPLSGTAGLFQHHPLYWAERAAAAGFPGAAPDDPEANIAAAAWLVAESVVSGLEPWVFWACRP